MPLTVVVARADTAATVLATDGGTLQSTRIVAEEPGMPIATPVVGSPTA